MVDKLKNYNDALRAVGVREGVQKGGGKILVFQTTRLLLEMAA